MHTQIKNSVKSDHDSIRSASNYFENYTDEADLFTNLFNNIPLGLLILDSKGIVRYCNDISLKQLDLDPIGCNWNSVINQAFLPSYSQHTDVRLGNGNIVNVNTSALRNNSGQLIMLTEVLGDYPVKFNKGRDDRLKILGSMMACLAHQIRTPLATAMLYATQKSGQKREDDLRNKICCSLKHIEQTINEMLLYTSKGKMEMKPVDVKLLVDEVLDLTGPVIKSSGCKFTVLMAAEDLMILVNKNSIISAIQNLIMNAIQACKHDGEIRLHILKADVDKLEILVSDNGSGITKEQQQHIFEPFYSHHKTNGTGIGLSIVDTVMRKHGGESWLESLPELGTTIGLIFPLHKSSIPNSKSNSSLYSNQPKKIKNESCYSGN